MMTKIYDLAYEIDGEIINLEQDMGCGEVSRVDLHPIHVRLLAEQIGILAPSSNIESDRTIARLCRQLRTLYQRIDFLDTYLHTNSDSQHADLSYEQTYSTATWELAHEFVSDLPAANTPESGDLSTAKTPNTGGVSPSNGSKNGGTSAQSALPLEGQS
jgi:hypothetical protein